MATASSAKTEVGTVKVMFGDVKIIGADGVARNTYVGDKVYAKEVIQTAANAVIQVQLADGRMLDLGRNSQLALDEGVLGASPAAVAGTPNSDIAAAQAAIARGEDPTKVTDPAAAGGNQAAIDEASTDSVVLNQANSSGPVTAGFQTNPVSIAFEVPQPFNQLPPLVPAVTPAALPVVTVRVDVEIPNTPPPSDGPADRPVARTDVDFISSGFLSARGNVITGAGTSSGTAGADTPSSEPTIVSAVTSATGHLATSNNGVLTIEGQFGVLTINPDGSYVYERKPGSPDGVVDTFTYTLKDASGDMSSANLIIDIGTPVIPGDEPGGDGAVVTVDGALILEGTHPDAKIVNFVITLDHPSTVPVEVTYEIRPATAQTPNDFFGVLTATVTIPPNATQFVVPVSIVQDHLVEGNETFNIVLTNASNATIDPEAGRAQITIVDDDRPPVAHDNTYDVVSGQPNHLSSVLPDDTGAGPFETLIVVKPDGSLVGNQGLTIITAQGGTVVILSDGTFTYNPPATLKGPDSFVYTMTDTVNGVPIGNGTSQATVTLNPANEPPTVKFNVAPGADQVFEAGLAIGSNPASDSEKTHGTFTISDPNGLADIAFIAINGQQIPLNSVPGTIINTPLGVMTLDAYNPNTGVVSFTYELTKPVQDVANQPEQDLFTVTVTDNNENKSAPATLAINIVDDVPTARNDSDTIAAGTFGPESGNVITGVGTTDPVAGKDTKGADGAVLTAITSPTGNLPTTATDGTLTINGEFGVLTIKPNGDYTYTRNVGTPGGVQDKFTYTLTDGDGDTSPAVLTINIGDAQPELVLKDSRVNEAGLPTGSHAGDGSTTTAGAITFNAKDGLQNVTVDGVPVTGTPGQQIPGDHGILTVTGFTFDPVTGAGTLFYSYTLTQPTAGDTTTDDFTVVVTDKNGSTSTGPLVISIIDDVPLARNDADAVNPLGQATGNVITGAGTTDPVTGKDTPGADTAKVTDISSPAGAPTHNPDGSLTIPGQFGVLTIQPNGEYTYTRNPGTPGGVTDTFRYTLTDADGDASGANLVISIGDAKVQLNLPGAQVNEAGLPTGSDAPSNSETTTGAITFNAKDGLQSVTLDGVTIATPVPGQTPQTVVGDHGTLTITGFTYDPVTGNGNLTYSYTLTQSTLGDTTSDDFAVVITDGNGDKATGLLTINIVDDVPTARNDSDVVSGIAPESGNVITAVGTTGTPGPDTLGADNAKLTNIASTNEPGNIPTNAAGVLTISGQYGVLTILPNGDYTYTRNPGTPGGVTDTFRYTLTDGDGDTSAANLVISIGNVGNVIDIPAVHVNEAGLPTGSDAASNSETTTGGLTFKSIDGLGSLTLDGVVVTGLGQTIPGDHGILTVTGFTYDPVSGNGALTYSYTLTQSTVGDTTSDPFDVVVTDKDGDKSSGTLTVTIIDDVPTAHLDVGTVTSGATLTASALTGVEANDVFGADGKAGLGVVGVKSGNDTTTPVTTGTGTQIVTSLGTLTLNADGSYNYTAKPNVSGADTFVYTIKDSDGDLSTTTLTINVNKVGPDIFTGTVLVDEAGLPTGSDPLATTETVVSSLGLPAGVTVVPGAQQDQTGVHGTLHVNPDGTFTYTLTSPVDSGPILGANVVNGVETFTVTIQDAGGNTSAATITVNVKDDVPAISVANATIPTLTVDETNLNVDASASFAGNFSAVFGADGAGSISYNLATGGPASGLTDVATGQPIILVQVGNTVEGHVGTSAGATAFVVSVNAAGVVTLDQQRALSHPNASNPDDAVSLAAGAIVLNATVTDRDGDTAKASLNLGDKLSFKDDGPKIIAGTVAGAVEEEALPVIGNQDTNDIPNTGLTASGSLTGLATFGADGAGSFSLDGSAIASLTAQSLKSSSVALTYTIAGDTLTAKAGALDVFTLQINAAGNYTFTLKSHLDHTPVQGENTLDINFGSLVKVTDRDGDSVNLGGTANFKITVQDDVPIPCPVTIIGAVDEDGLSGANADAGRLGEVTSTGVATTTGSLATLASFGADGPASGGGFSLNNAAAALDGLRAQGLTQDGVDVAYSISGNTVTATGVGGQPVFILTLNSSGAYTFTLLSPVQHSSGQGENSLTLDFSSLINVTDADGDTITLGVGGSHAGVTPAKFLITVQDDIPVAADITRSTAGNAGAVTNLTLVLDVSGSMTTASGIAGLTRLDAEKQSAIALIDEYAALGNVKISLVKFSDTASALGYWLDADAAKAAITGLTAGGTTNYSAGLDLAKLGYDGAHNTLLPNAQDVLYFLSDGVPNPVATGLDTPAEVTAWENFVKGAAGSGNVLGEKITAYALGIGPDTVSGAGALNPIAYNGVSATDTNAIIVSNFVDLTQTLIATVQAAPISGSLLTDPVVHTGFGADGGWVQVVNVDGKTYVYDQKADATTGSTGSNGTFNTVTNQWTITTANSGKIVIDMDDGAYTYTPPANLAGSKVENIGFTLTDRDGDTASANLKINVEGPSLVVGQNVNDQPGQATAHKVDPVAGNTGVIGGGGANDILIGDVGGSSLQGKSTNVILMLDTSGSMSTAFGAGQPTRLQGLKDGINDVLETLAHSGADNVRVHINHFSTTVDAGTAGAQTFDLVVNGTLQTAGLNNAHGFVNSFTASGFTNYEASLQEALNWVNGAQVVDPIAGANVVNQAVFVSDGEPNTAVNNDGSLTSLGSLTTAQAIDNIYGRNGDAVGEQQALDAFAANSSGMQAIGMGLNAAELNVLTQVEGVDATAQATNTTNALEFKTALADVNPTTALGAVGNDVISGGAGNDIIYGDSVNTDVLGAAKGLGLPTGSGWTVFQTLEAGAGWTRTDTMNYIRTHQGELAAESTSTGGAKRAGGNDTIDAGAGNDTVYGQEGNDIIIGGAGNDILSGGSGSDTFKWNNADKGTGATPATDTIRDFGVATTGNNNDVLDLRDLLQGETHAAGNSGNLSSYLSFSQTGADVTLSVHSAGAAGAVDQKIVLQGITMAQLAGSNSADSAGVIANLLTNNKLITD